MRSGQPTVPHIYLLSAITSIDPLRFLVRSTLPPETLIPEVRRAIQGVDSALPIHHVAMMSDIVDDSMSLERVGSFMMVFFALAALLMASLGIYGVVGTLFGRPQWRSAREWRSALSAETCCAWSSATG